MPELDDIIQSVMSEAVTPLETSPVEPVEPDVTLDSSANPEPTTEPEVEPEPLPVTEKKHETTVPYERLQEVIEERNLLRELLGRTKEPESPVEPDPEPEEELPEFESEGERLLYQMVLDVKSQLQAKDAEIEELKGYTTKKQEDEFIQSVKVEVDAAFTKIGGEFTDEQRQAMLNEASTYATNPDLTVEDALVRAYHYLTGTGKLTVARATPDARLQQVQAKKESLVSTQRQQPAPKNSASIESVNSFEEALAHAARTLGDNII